MQQGTPSITSTGDTTTAGHGFALHRLRVPDDVAGKAHVHWQAWRKTYGGLMDHDLLFSRTLELSEERAWRAVRLGVQTFVAVDTTPGSATEGQVVGFCDYGPYREDDLPDAGEVFALYVLRSHQGMGVGRALMDAAVRELAGFPQVAVWVMDGNERALRFYERYGYRADGARQALTDLGEGVTDSRMVLRLD